MKVNITIQQLRDTERLLCTRLKAPEILQRTARGFVPMFKIQIRDCHRAPALVRYPCYFSLASEGVTLLALKINSQFDYQTPTLALTLWVRVRIKMNLAAFLHINLGFCNIINRRHFTGSRINRVVRHHLPDSTSLSYSGKRWATMSTIRQDMVKRAVAFLRHPSVKGAPREKQLAFLKGKALTQEVNSTKLLSLVHTSLLVHSTTVPSRASTPSHH